MKRKLLRCDQFLVTNQARFYFSKSKGKYHRKKGEAREERSREKKKKKQLAAIKIDTEKHAKSAFSQHSKIAKNGKISTTAFKIAEV